MHVRGKSVQQTETISGSKQLMTEGEVVMVVHEPVAHLLLVVADAERVFRVILAPSIVACIGLFVMRGFLCE